MSPGCYAGSGGDFLEQFRIESCHINDYLYIINGGTVIERYEIDILVSSLSPYPALGEHLHSRLSLQKVLDLGSNYFFHNVNLFAPETPSGIKSRKDTIFRRVFSKATRNSHKIL